MKQDKQPTTVARLPRYPHDLSFDRSWTSSTGHIIPVVHDFLNAGETIRCSVDLRTRMQPILRPAMLDIHQKIKYFFVPMDMLYSLFEAIRYQVNDYFSTNFNVALLSREDGFPLANFTSLFSAPLPGIKDYRFDSANSGQDNCDLFAGSDGLDVSANGTSDFKFFDQWHQGAHRLLDSLLMCPDYVLNGAMNNLPSGYSFMNPNVFPYALLAYQAVYYNYFRDEDYEANQQQAYNIDLFYSSSLFQTNLDKMLTLRYVGRFKDYFTNVHPNPLINSMSLLTGANSEIYLSEANNYLNDSAVKNPEPSISEGQLLNNHLSSVSYVRSTGFVPDSNTDVSNYKQQINASQLRMLFAVDKLLSVTGRARKRVDDQVLAHFGFKIPLDVKHNIQYIGEQDGSFAVGDVVSTADTTGAVLGELAGKAYGRVQGNGVDKFTAPCDGVFIGLYYSMPVVRYDSGFAKKNAVAKREDLFIPEFDHLGMQPMYNYEHHRLVVSNTQTTISGWQWRYEQWKRNYNTVSTAFKQGFNGGVNVLSAWTPIMFPNRSTNNPVMTFQSLKVTPHDLDNIMKVPFNSTFLPSTSTSLGVKTTDVGDNPYLFYSYDPFIHDMHVSYKKVSVMSTFSIPSLDNNC